MQSALSSQQKKLFTRVCLAVGLYFTLFIVQLSFTHSLTWPLLFGNNTVAIFDTWTLQHVCAGIVIGAGLLWLKSALQRGWVEFALVIFLITICWEAVELAIEAGVLGQVITHWKGGFEHWSNRFIGDPGAVVLGALIARRFIHAWKIVLLPVVAWAVVSVLSPNSMYIQQVLFK